MLATDTIIHCGIVTDPRRGRALMLDLRREFAPCRFAVYTIPRNESAVARHLALLALLGVEHFLPTVKTVRTWKNRAKAKVALPLFPCYLFIRIQWKDRPRVWQTPGVLRIVGNGKEPLSVPYAVIDLTRVHQGNGRLEPYTDLVSARRSGFVTAPCRTSRARWYAETIVSLSLFPAVQTAGTPECRRCGQRRKATSGAPPTQGVSGSRAVRDPVHVRKHLVREPGDPASACGGESRRPHREVEARTPMLRRWVVEGSFAWAARFRRLARDDERLAATLGAFHFLACACLVLANLFKMLTRS